ncbi:hypothetical protein ACRRTK_002610 [Alexandromys fortis]
MVIEGYNCNLNHGRKIVKVENIYTATSQIPRALTMGDQSRITFQECIYDKQISPSKDNCMVRKCYNCYFLAQLHLYVFLSTCQVLKSVQ